MENIFKNDRIMLQINIDTEKAKTQKKIIIEGIEIYFPYNPYQVQITYMKKVISSLNNKGAISALESPTGTGKTLCLLCSILAWIKYNKKEDIIFYYCTRTISQIKNIMKEFNKTCYVIQTSFLTSRKYTCPNISDENRNKYDISKLNELCELKRKDNKCKYYKDPENYNYYKYNNLEDIEDLFLEGKKLEFCPYYYNLKKTHLYANLTFMPYNYILDPYIRDKLNVIKNNAIIVLDEAHNICNAFEDLYSKKVKKKDLEKIEILLRLILDFNNINKKEKDIDNDDLNPLFGLKSEEINKEINNIKNLLNHLEKLEPGVNVFWEKIYDNINKNCYLCKIEYFRFIFKSFSLKFYRQLNDIINKLNNEEENSLKEFYEESNKIIDKIILLKLFKSIIKKPQRVLEFLEQLNNLTKKEEISFKFIFSNQKESYNYNYNLIENKNNENNYNYKKENIFFEIYCVDASYGMKDLLKINPHSIILTSGTLSVKMIENMLQIHFYEILHNDHVVKDNQFLANIIFSFQNINTKSKSNFSFILKNRGDKDQIKSMGNEIYNLANSVKEGGVLVFFQSYEFLNACYKIWHKQRLIKKLKLIKNTIFDLKHLKDKNEEKIKNGKKDKNLLLFSVYRGKNSEGINFVNDEARMVVCVGMPYPNLSDIKVKLKMDFLDEKFEKEKKGYKYKGYKGWDWYREEAMVVVNQSLGRLLRNKEDYGIMICLGIEIKNNIFLFSNWIKNNIICVELNENNDDYYQNLENFLSYMNSNMNMSKNNNDKLLNNSINFIEKEKNEKEELSINNNKSKK